MSKAKKYKETYEKHMKEMKTKYESGNSFASYVRRVNLKLHLTDEQKQQVAQELGNFRYIYNTTLAYLWNKFESKEDGLTIGRHDLMNEIIKRLQKEHDWIMLSSAQSNQNACFEAYEAFWKMAKNAKATMAKRKAAGKYKPLRPRFKRRHEGRQSYYVSSQMCKFKNLDFTNRTLKMSKLGEVKFYYRKIRDEENIISVRESRLIRAYDQYYLSLTIVLKRKKRESKGNIPAIGIDWGVRNLATITDGKDFVTIDNFIRMNKKSMGKVSDGEIRKLQKKIEAIQKIIDRKAKINKKHKLADPYHTNNIQKLRAKVYWCYQRISYIKSDYLNKLVWNIVKRRPRSITIEDLQVSDQLMKFPEATAKDKRLRKLIALTSPYMFKQKLISVCIREQVELLAVPSDYPSSQICSECGKKNEMPLEKRKFVCPHCGSKIDRDENAALNILNCPDKFVLVTGFGRLPDGCRV